MVTLTLKLTVPNAKTVAAIEELGYRVYDGSADEVLKAILREED